MSDVMLSTSDNPYDPFSQWDDWLTWDTASGYNSTALLARTAVVSPDQSETDQELALVSAMEEIVDANYSGVHIIVTKHFGAS